ncbi:unnamed protein product [marine sediment metagenome]|uniref:Uncharacterized protein n=1 Tax=marine sediment metagenome TaxID=412755 RepID=X0RH19_9ZZZZ
MELRIPLTGTIEVEGAYKEGKLVGKADDPIRIIPIDLGNVSWTLKDIDLVDEVAIIEVVPSPVITKVVGDVPVTRPATKAEKTASLNHAKGRLAGKTKDDLYLETKSAKLKRLEECEPESKSTA